MSTSRRNVVLILGDAEDVHVKSVTSEIVRIGCSVVAVDVWSPWEALSLSFERESDGLIRDGRRLDVSSVWSRLKPRLGGGLAEAEAFAIRERREFLLGATGLSCLPQHWINDPWAQESARNKLLQLRLASTLGLQIPPTLVSNDPEEVLAFANSGSILYKPLTWLASLDGRVLFANELKADQIVNNAEAISRAPGIYQSVIVKKFEYRVTIVDQEVFVVRIHSQERSDTSLDWRRNQEELRYEVSELPSALIRQLLKLNDMLKLRYSAIDLIETPAGEYVFLEVNPGGQWLWLEERAGIQVSNCLARALCSTE